MHVAFYMIPTARKYKQLTSNQLNMNIEKKPAKGGFRNFVSPEIGGCFQREGTSIILCVP